MASPASRRGRGGGDEGDAWGPAGPGRRPRPRAPPGGRGPGPGEGGWEENIRSAALPGLRGAAHDLVERDEVGRAAQIRSELALRERAEAAAEVADVRVLNVPRDDVRGFVAADLAAEPVGGGADMGRLLAARLEEPGDLLLAELGSDEIERHHVTTDDEGSRARLAPGPPTLAPAPPPPRPPPHPPPA